MLSAAIKYTAERAGRRDAKPPPVAGAVLSMWLDDYNWSEIAAEIGSTEEDADRSTS
jgi:hypothetical protein